MIYQTIPPMMQHVIHQLAAAENMRPADVLVLLTEYLLLNLHRGAPLELNEYLQILPNQFADISQEHKPTSAARIELGDIMHMISNT
jgi:nucleoid-associated protein YejK